MHARNAAALEVCLVGNSDGCRGGDGVDRVDDSGFMVQGEWMMGLMGFMGLMGLMGVLRPSAFFILKKNINCQLSIVNFQRLSIINCQFPKPFAC